MATSPLEEVLRSARLWRIWTRLGLQDVRLRYRRSVIGVGWIFLNLAVMVLAVGYVYGHLLGQDLHEFIPYLTAGLVTWGYLTNSIVEGAQAFIGSEGYIKQISLPIYVYVFRCFVAVSLSSCVSFLAFFVVAVIYDVRFRPGTLWAVPGMLLLMMASLLLVNILAHLNARYRDTGQLAAVALQVVFYVTPVLFPAQLLRDRGLFAIVQLNPLFHLVEVMRRPLLHGTPADSGSYVGSAAFILVLALIGVWLMTHYGRRIVFWL